MLVSWLQLMMVMMAMMRLMITCWWWWWWIWSDSVRQSVAYITCIPGQEHVNLILVSSQCNSSQEDLSSYQDISSSWLWAKLLLLRNATYSSMKQHIPILLIIWVVFILGFHMLSFNIPDESISRNGCQTHNKIDEVLFSFQVFVFTVPGIEPSSRSRGKICIHEASGRIHRDIIICIRRKASDIWKTTIKQTERWTRTNNILR